MLSEELNSSYHKQKISNELGYSKGPWDQSHHTSTRSTYISGREKVEVEVKILGADACESCVVYGCELVP